MPVLAAAMAPRTVKRRACEAQSVRRALGDTPVLFLKRSGLAGGRPQLTIASPDGTRRGRNGRTCLAQGVSPTVILALRRDRHIGASG